jgi:hypothetical protein
VPPQLLAPQPVPAAPLQPPQGAQPSAPKIVITPPPPQRTPKIQKRHLEAIPEEDEATGSRHPKIEAEDVLAAQGASGGSPPKTLDQLGQRRWADFPTSDDEQLRDIFEQLALSHREKTIIKVSPSSCEDTTPAFQSAVSSPQTPKPVLSPPGAAAGPPSQRTRQMEKDLANTLYKRQLEAEALEKKKKKELAQETEDRKKAEDELVKAIYKQSLEAKIKEKQRQTEIKKEKKWSLLPRLLSESHSCVGFFPLSLRLFLIMLSWRKSAKWLGPYLTFTPLFPSTSRDWLRPSKISTTT